MPQEVFLTWYYNFKGEEKISNKPTHNTGIYRNTELKDSTLTYLISSAIYLLIDLS